MGDGDISNEYRSVLKSNINELMYEWKATNAKKSSDYISNESYKGGLSTIFGAVIGGILGGPPGAVIGAALGGAGSAIKSSVNSGGNNINANCAQLQ